MLAKDNEGIRDVTVRAAMSDYAYEVVRIAIFAVKHPVSPNEHASPYEVVLHEGEWKKREGFPFYTEFGQRIYREDAQTLMDDLWRCGIRPTEGAGSAGAMAATLEHVKQLKEENAWLRSKVDQLLRAVTTGD